MRASTGVARTGTVQSRTASDGDVVTTGESIHLLVGAYAVDALDPADRARFAEHLDHCPDCLDELAGLHEAAGRVADLSATAPPPGLRARVLTAIDLTRPLPPVAPTRPHRAERRSDHAVRPRARLVALLTVAAAVVILLLLAGLTTLGQSADTSATAAASIQDASDAKRSLVESDAGWSATVWHSDSRRQAMLVTENMPAPPRGTVYQLWLDQPSSGTVSAGLVPLGQPHQTVVLVGDAASANGVSITLEPVGGSEHPTADPIAVFDFGRAAPDDPTPQR